MNIHQNKGGRPKKELSKNKRLSVACTPEEQNIIAVKAKILNLTISEYLRSLGIQRYIDAKQKVIPKEVLLLTGTINHIASNVNQLAKRNNAGQNFTHSEREQMRTLSAMLLSLTEQIKDHLQ